MGHRRAKLIARVSPPNSERAFGIPVPKWEARPRGGGTSHSPAYFQGSNTMLPLTVFSATSR